jgi:two-component system chemotaxis response regulator CheY
MTEAMRVLIVDDSMAVRSILEQILMAIGCEVASADGAREALRILRRFRPDLILTDYAMPGLDGCAFVRLVRRDARFQAVPILVVSSEEDPDKRWAMTRAGADAWFSKPIDPARLVRAVHASTLAARPPAIQPHRPWSTSPRTSRVS